ncbi:MAG: hypothetical protein CME06_09315 [Gemmatimonadetes bacterium]|nr:hypothetical protein [Gemmatimonadota bacterium]
MSSTPPADSTVQSPSLAPRSLGRSGLLASRLGLGSSYAAPTSAYEEAFERGVNYFYWGSRRRGEMARAIREIAPRHRDSMLIVVQSYARFGALVRASTLKALRSLRIDQADVLLLGWHNSPPTPRVIDAAIGLIDAGHVRHLAISGHRRTMFPALLDEQRYSIWHLRYNAVHRGAERDVFPALTQLEAAGRPGIVTYTTTRWGHLCDPRRTPPDERPPTGTDCYRFALSNPHVDTVMAGPNSRAQMRQALDALTLGPMNDEELAWMRRVGDHIYGSDRTSKARDRV